MPKIYRSARGKIVDIDKLRLMNEETVAAGNQLVNARGDKLNHLGQVSESRNDIMNNVYKRKVNSPNDEPVYETVEQSTTNSVEPDLIDSRKLQEVIEKIQNNSFTEQSENSQTEDKVITTVEPVAKSLRGGLASAIQKDLD
jgi:hypothetical protein